MTNYVLNVLFLFGFVFQIPIQLSPMFRPTVPVVLKFVPRSRKEEWQASIRSLNVENGSYQHLDVM